jgi:hypothetical protein
MRHGRNSVLDWDDGERRGMKLETSAGNHSLTLTSLDSTSLVMDLAVAEKH